MRHAFSHFVEGAIAAGGEDEIGAAGDLVARQGTGGARAGGGAAGDAMAIGFKDPHGARDQGAALPAEFTRTRIVNHDSLAVSGYGERSQFLVRL